MKTLLLVDGSSYLYRAFHALPDLRTSTGEPTGAIRGFVSMLRLLRQQIPADYLACVFDAKGKTFRDDIYAEYKANRPPMPDDLARQLDPIREAARALGWPVLEIEGIEADDVIGTLARQAESRGVRAVISTGDKDLAQLVNEHVTLVNTMSNEKLDISGVVAKFGVKPEQIVDYLTLVGDSVDNVPGVEKVGPKTAAKWLQQYGSLDAIVANADQIGGVVGENLRKALPWLPTAKTLVTVKTDNDIAAHVPHFDALQAQPPDENRLRELYARWEFKSFLKELGGEAADNSSPFKGEAGRGMGSEVVAREPHPHPNPSTASLVGDAGSGGAEQGSANSRLRPLDGEGAKPNVHYETILTESQLDAWLTKINAAELTCIDTETTSLDPMAAKLVGISLAVEPLRACYIPLAHRYPGAPEQLALDATLAKLKPWLESARHKKVGQHLKYDAHVFANHGLRLEGIAHDTLLQSYVLEAHRNHDMDSLAERHLGRTTITYEQVCGKGANQIGFDEVSIDRATEYSAEDAEVTLALHHALWPRIADDARLRYVYEDIEIPVSRVLLEMERAGVLIDRDKLLAQSRELAARMAELEARAHELAGQPFNLGSPKQIGEILFGKLGLPVVKKTASGAPSTDEEVLEKLALDYPLPKALLEYRALSKLKSTYCDKLPASVDPQTGRVHTSYGQAIAVTGRLSSSEPNLQNIPIRTPEGRRIRETFIAPPGSRIVSADYSQIELRIMAHISGDEGLLAAFAAGEDIHRATASEVFGVPVGEVTSEQRRYAKVINFGLIYGMSAFGLASNLGIEKDAARSYIDRYFTRYPGVARYMETTRALAKRQGYVETVFGRRLWLPEINSPNGPRRAGAERAAINAPMQGTAADLIKLAMIAVADWLRREQLATQLIMQVHDELVFEAPEAEVELVKTKVPELMSGVAELKVRLVAEVGVGSNWDEAH
ncbi:DNA polymerase I [Betaproteobacteria bacterium PRO7]|nr:DNA polymerase I [Betaproteobacteria bacterium PRO7]